MKIKIITLSKPFKLQSEKEITEFQLNFEDLSTADFRQISRLESMVSDNGTVALDEALIGKALSFKFQLASGFLAAIKGTDGLQTSDFLRVPMQDALMLAKKASFFGFMRTENTGGHTPLHGTVLLTGIRLA